MGNLERLQLNLNQGHAAANQQDWQLAVDCYRKALDEMPDNPVTLLSLGQAYFELEKYPDALACFTQLSVLNPDDPAPFEKIATIFGQLEKNADAAQAFIKTADIYMNQKNIEKAIDSWLRAVYIQPDNVTARTRLSLIYERLGRKEDAVKEYLMTASIYQNTGNADKAKQVIEYCLQILPDNKEAKHYLELINNNRLLPRFDKKDNKKEHGVYKAGIKEDHKNTPTISLNPVMECRQKAVSALSSSLVSSDNEKTGSGISVEDPNQSRIRLYLSQALDSLTTDNEKSAIEDFEKAFNLGCHDSSAYYLHGFLCYANNNPATIKSLMKAVDHDDYALGAFLLIGQVLTTQGKFIKAFGAYMNALCIADASSVPQEQYESLIQAYEPLMVSYQKQLDEENAIKINEKISKLLMVPNWREVMKQARSHLPAEQSDSMPTPLGEIYLEQKGDQLLELLSYIGELIQEDKLPSALEEAYFAINWAPSYLPLQQLIADLLYQSGKTSEAIHKYTLLSTLYELRGEVEKSGRILSRLVQAAPMDIILRDRLIEFLFNRGRHEEALQETLNLADIFYRLSDFDKARSTYSEAQRLVQELNLEPSNHIQILYKMADIDLQRLDFRQAIRVFEQIRNLVPDDLAVRQKLSEIYLRTGQDNAAVKETSHILAVMKENGQKEEMVEFLSTLVKIKGENLELRKYLADALVRDSRIPEAVEQLDAIANTLLDNGNISGATTLIKAIIALNPPNVQEYQKALTQIDKL